MDLERFYTIAECAFGYTQQACRDITMLDVKRSEAFVKARLGNRCFSCCFYEETECEASALELGTVFHALATLVYNPETSAKGVNEETLDYLKSLGAYSF